MIPQTWAILEFHSDNSPILGEHSFLSYALRLVSTLTISSWVETGAVLGKEFIFSISRSGQVLS